MRPRMSPRATPKERRAMRKGLMEHCPNCGTDARQARSSAPPVGFRFPAGDRRRRLACCRSIWNLSNGARILQPRTSMRPAIAGPPLHLARNRQVTRLPVLPAPFQTSQQSPRRPPMNSRCRGRMLRRALGRTRRLTPMPFTAPTTIGASRTPVLHRSWSPSQPSLNSGRAKPSRGHSICSTSFGSPSCRSGQRALSI